MNLLIILLILLIVVAIFITISYRIGKSYGRRERQEDSIIKHNEYLKELVFRDRQIQELQSKIDTLNNLNDKYLSLTLKIPFVVQRLNTTLDIQEIIISIKH